MCGAQPRGSFPALCPSQQKASIEVPPHACSCHEEPVTTVLCSGQVSSLTYAQDGRTLGVPITLLSERTMDWPLDPRTWRIHPGKILQILQANFISFMAHLLLVVPVQDKGASLIQRVK